jgi:hypothetical protein
MAGAQAISRSGAKSNKQAVGKNMPKTIVLAATIATIAFSAGIDHFCSKP